MGSLVGSGVKNLFADTVDWSLIPGYRRSPGEGNGNPLQYSCLEDPMDRGDWNATYRSSGRKELGALSVKQHHMLLWLYLKKELLESHLTLHSTKLMPPQQ